MNFHSVKSNTVRCLAVLALFVTIIAIPAAAQLSVNQFGPPASKPGTGACTTCLAPLPALTAEQTAPLQFMREEEKLARDVYQALYAKWNVRIFDRISESEQRHFDSIGRQLTLHGITDPALDKKAGEFTNPDLQKLYTDLLVKGELSLKDALEVGKLVEETDIEDLEKILETETDATLKRVYNSLLNGSLNHLDAFEGYIEIYSAQ
ncbi:MAG TPA: DUF2202 domain-containing protein [Bryobacteraceae bacterium]|nr:DUF2202 domain-containing protein [Bryobacteraceae bacterium]